MKIGFLGLGKMGTPLAKRLMAASHDVTVWNRTRERAEALTSAGAQVASTPAEAARDADAVMTMLFDDEAHEEVLFGADGVLNALKPGAMHISLSTISVALSERLTEEHASADWPLWRHRFLDGQRWPRKASCGLWLQGRTMRSSWRTLCWNRFREVFQWWARNRARPTP